MGTLCPSSARTFSDYSLRVGEAAVWVLEQVNQIHVHLVSAQVWGRPWYIASET